MAAEQIPLVVSRASLLRAGLANGTQDLSMKP
jgi:hypothetical protein